MQPSFAPRNIPSLAGQPAANSRSFGEFGRYRVTPIHSRFEQVSWFVKDAEKTDADGFATVIRQEDTFEAAVAGLA